MQPLRLIVLAALGVALITAFFFLTPISFLQPNEQLVIKSISSSSVQNGPKVAFFVPILERAHKRMALNLEEESYAEIKDALTGEVKLVAGPQLYFLGPYESHETTSSKIVLTDRQFIRLLDKKSGTQRLVRGPATFTPRALETFREGVQDALKLKEMDYAIVTDTLTGAQRVESGPQLFFPGVHEAAGHKQEMLALKKHECSGQPVVEPRALYATQSLAPL